MHHVHALRVEGQEVGGTPGVRQAIHWVGLQGMGQIRKRRTIPDEEHLRRVFKRNQSQFCSIYQPAHMPGTCRRC